MSQSLNYLVCGHRIWSYRAFHEVLTTLPGAWHFTSSPSFLTRGFVEFVKPDKIFFPHWSSIIPADIFDNWECIGFLSSDLPYGRGGSPIQNLIATGATDTKLSAFRITEHLDAGDIYLKKPLSLEGSAEEIYLRMSYLTAFMIREIIETSPTPTPQEGKYTLFRRRQPHESEIPECRDLYQLFRHIQMLDAEGYPKAFLIRDSFRYEFSRVQMKDGKLIADVEIEPLSGVMKELFP